MPYDNDPLDRRTIGGPPERRTRRGTTNTETKNRNHPWRIIRRFGKAAATARKIAAERAALVDEQDAS